MKEDPLPLLAYYVGMTSRNECEAKTDPPWEEQRPGPPRPRLADHFDNVRDLPEWMQKMLVFVGLGIKYQVLGTTC